jgi:hypothetical protein
MARKQQISIAFDPELRARLEAMAKAQGVSIADEIRNRLDGTLVQDAYAHGLDARKNRREVEEEIIRLLRRERREEHLFDAPTRELALDIKELARAVSFSREAGWHNNSIVYAALVAAVNTFLTAQKPLPEDDDKGVIEEMEQLDYEPQSTGRALAHLRLREKEDNNHRERERLQERQKQTQERQKQTQERLDKLQKKRPKS